MSTFAKGRLRPTIAPSVTLPYRSGPRLSEKKGYVEVSRWSRGVDLFSTKLLFVPVAKDDHWSLVCIANLCELLKVWRCIKSNRPVIIPTGDEIDEIDEHARTKQLNAVPT